MNQTTDQPTRTLTGFEVARDIATWLPEFDQRRALAIIEHHERLHETAAQKTEEQEQPQGAD